MRAAKHQKASASFCSTASSGAAKSLMPCAVDPHPSHHSVATSVKFEGVLNRAAGGRLFIVDVSLSHSLTVRQT